MIRYKNRLILLAGAAGILFSAAPSFAQQSSSAAAMEIRFQQMEKEIRRLTGQLEEQQYEIRNLQGDVTRLQEMLNLTAGGQGNAVGQGLSPSDQLSVPVVIDNSPLQGGIQNEGPEDVSGTLGTLTVPADDGGQAATTAPHDDASAYDHAYSFIKNRDYAQAERAFSDFIRTHSQSALLPNARYWYGETFYVRGDYEHAARIFAEGYQKNPKGPKAPGNLLKLGMSLVGMGKREDACIAFQQIQADYATSSIPVLRRAQTEMKKNNCS